VECAAAIEVLECGGVDGLRRRGPDVNILTAAREHYKRLVRVEIEQ
jgi:hypothetical protein